MEDSTLDTLRHSRRVDELLLEIVQEIQDRMLRHDESKLHTPEKEAFDIHTQRLRTSVYGSDEYKANLEAMRPALDHHYANNRHHPEHFNDGVNGMTLVDVVEMLADWKAATERHDDGDLSRSLTIQQQRFDMSAQFTRILRNTATELGWIKE